jgi:hypothetical protein|tara:strand:- start:71732 stop:71893 length:162 start_codon:yes stop_codon:yes gene_type:complete
MDREDTPKDSVDSSLPELYHKQTAINLSHLYLNISVYSDFEILNTDNIPTPVK